MIVLGTVALYGVLLGMQIYSARQASQLLDQVEAIRTGAPYADFERAIRDCRFEHTASSDACELRAGAYRFDRLWALVWKLPDEWSKRILRLSSRAGLRYWRLNVLASRENDRVRTVSLGLFVVGRYEALGTGWLLADTIRPGYQPFTKTADDRRTYLHWYHITSVPSGEGFSISATPNSTDRELLARRINRKCFTSFRGCDGLCELLPNAGRILKERNRGWGGITDVPCSWCDLPTDACKHSWHETR